MIEACCCSHVHKTTCLWYRSTASSAHKHHEHVPQCRCINNNNCIHSISCKWALEFNEKYCPDREFTDDEFFDGKFLVCCCSPEIPHGESMKFTILAKNQEVLQQSLFKRSGKTEVGTVSPLPEYLRPPFIGK